MSATQRRPQDFLELVERQRRGRLKVYLGYAAGVGKTYRMLEDAHELRKRGVDVVVGFVETHGRSETDALVDGLEVVPRRGLEYRGVTIEELDLDAVFLRAPAICVIDEVAHTNVPGSRNRRRYEDILELLEAGINVLCAFNVQHLESLHDLVERATQVTVRETIPDTFLQRADQVVTLDLAIEDLVDRMRTGKIYAPEKVDTALESFFRPKNLASLRELALREVAESVERSVLAPSGEAPTDARRPVAWKVMVCMASATPRAATLLRRGSRLAGRLNTDWYAVYVETPREAPNLIDAEAQRRLHQNIAMARELGAEVIRLRAHDPVAALLDFARSHRVGHLMIGRTEGRRWRRLFRRDAMSRIVDEAVGIDVHIVSFQDAETAP